MGQINTSTIHKELPIFDTIIDNHDRINRYLSSLIDDEQSNPEYASHESNVKAWHTDYLLHLNNKKFEPIINLAIKFCEHVSSEYYSTEDLKYGCVNFWAMRYTKGNYAIKHNHFPADFSCVYYVDVKEKSSPIIFEDTHVVYPKNGMMILFPGSIDHDVPPTDHDRTVVSLNLRKL
jgi:hypothetical protein